MTDRMVNDDDLRLFLLMHRAIRGDLARLPRAVATLVPGDLARIEAIGQWLGFIERSIEHHHRGEDTWVYPRLSERDPSFVPEHHALERDHQALDPALAAVRTALAALAESARFERDRDALVAQLDALEVDMRRHLDAEEDAVIPRMKKHVRHAEIAEFEREGARNTSVRDLARVLPWVLSFADARELAQVDAMLPWPVKLLYRWSWKKGYQRFSAALQVPALQEAA